MNLLIYTFSEIIKTCELKLYIQILIMRKEQTDLIFNIINSIGALATFGAFVMLFLKDKDKQKQIKKLTSISKSMVKLQEVSEKKLKLIVAPKLWLNGAGTTHDGEVKIDLNNKGERATLIDFTLISGDVILHSKSLPWDLEKNSSRYIFARNNSEKRISDCVYKIEVLYEDALKNSFIFILEGVGSNVNVISDNEKI